ncbi:MAG: ester cyclase [Actinomycetota bacterium]
MSTRAELEALYSSYLDACNAHDLARMSTFYSPDIKVNDAPMQHDAVAAQFAPIFAAFPDWHWTVRNLAIDGDLISLHFTVTGTHRGTYLDLPATHRRVAITQFTLYRVTDGLFADVWDLADMAAIPGQLTD